MTVRCGDTLLFQTLPVIAAGAAVGGKKEGEGPLGERFDYVAKNDRMGQRSWELAESELQKRALDTALRMGIATHLVVDQDLALGLLEMSE